MLKVIIWFGIIVGLIAWLVIAFRGETTRADYSARDFVYQNLAPPQPIYHIGIPSYPAPPQQIYFIATTVPPSSYVYAGPGYDNSRYKAGAGYYPSYDHQRDAISTAFHDLMNTYWQAVANLNYRLGP